MVVPKKVRRTMPKESRRRNKKLLKLKLKD
jgi:hypothetical protein